MINTLQPGDIRLYPIGSGDTSTYSCWKASCSEESPGFFKKDEGNVATANENQTEYNKLTRYRRLSLVAISPLGLCGSPCLITGYSVGEQHSPVRGISGAGLDTGNISFYHPKNPSPIKFFTFKGGMKENPNYRRYEPGASVFPIGSSSSGPCKVSFRNGTAKRKRTVSLSTPEEGWSRSGSSTFEIRLK